MEDLNMKNITKLFLLVATMTSGQMFAERSCNARDNDCSSRRISRHNHHCEEDKYDRDGLASYAIRPVDWVLGDADVVRTVSTPARVPVDEVLPPWQYIDRD